MSIKVSIEYTNTFRVSKNLYWIFLKNFKFQNGIKSLN